MTKCYDLPELPDRRYNGWSNYETWCVILWLDNEPGSSEEKQAIIRHARTKGHAANALKDRVQGMCPDLGASMYADLLGAALSNVDWNEIVDHTWDEEHEEEDE